jgi:hypothetical protein
MPQSEGIIYRAGKSLSQIRIYSLISSTISAYFYKSTCLLLEPGLKHASGLMDESGLGGVLRTEERTLGFPLYELFLYGLSIQADRRGRKGIPVDKSGQIY